jgi:ribosomal-protein-alanine N-acetyltransferase
MKDVWKVRQATLADEVQLRQLIEQAERVVLRFHAEDLANYLTREPFLLAEEPNRLRGFLAFFMPQPPQATLAAAGLADDWAISPWLDRLLSHCVAYLRTRSVTALSYLGTAAWLTEPLQERGFRLVSHVVAYEKIGWAIPDGGNQAVNVRPVQSTDFSDLVTLDALVFHPLWRNSIETLKRWKEIVPYFVVAVTGEKPVGYCYCSVEKGHGHLIRMAVLPGWQGRGVGARLLAEAMHFFRQVGTRLITLNTQEENEQAQRLYRKFGFQLMGWEAVALWMDL